MDPEKLEFPRKSLTEEKNSLKFWGQQEEEDLQLVRIGLAAETCD